MHMCVDMCGCMHVCLCKHECLYACWCMYAWVLLYDWAWTCAPSRISACMCAYIHNCMCGRVCRPSALTYLVWANVFHAKSAALSQILDESQIGVHVHTVAKAHPDRGCLLGAMCACASVSARSLEIAKLFPRSSAKQWPEKNTSIVLCETLYADSTNKVQELNRRVCMCTIFRAAMWSVRRDGRGLSTGLLPPWAPRTSGLE